MFQSVRNNLRSRYTSIAGNSTAQNLRILRSRSCVPRLQLIIFLFFTVLPHLTNKLITKCVISQFLDDEFKKPKVIFIFIYLTSKQLSLQSAVFSQKLRILVNVKSKILADNLLGIYRNCSTKSIPRSQVIPDCQKKWQPD